MMMMLLLMVCINLCLHHSCCNVCRSLKTVLSVWLETYPDDFHEPPEYYTLTSLLQFALCNAVDNDLAQKARDQLSAFRDRDSSEHIGSGLGMYHYYCNLQYLGARSFNFYCTLDEEHFCTVRDVPQLHKSCITFVAVKYSL